jgi:hypothetical protein
MKRMKVAVYLAHPSQYHFLKNPINAWKKKGHEVIVIIRTKDILKDLLDFDQVPYIHILTKERKGNTLAIQYALIKRIMLLFFHLRSFKPDILIGSDASLPVVARLLHARSITALEDDYEVIKPLAMLTYPLTHVILTPYVCKVGKWEMKKVGYHGYMKLSALHPNHFVANHDIINALSEKKPYCLIRLSGLKAYHDRGKHGLSVAIVEKMIVICEKHGFRVWINAENALPVSLQQYQLTLHAAMMHHVLAGAKLLISDSQSMSVEASMLGIPSLRFSDFAGKISVLEELEHTYHLTKGISTDAPEALLKQLDEWLQQVDLTERFRQRNLKMLQDKVDVAAFVTWFVEDYGTTHAMNNAEHRFLLVNCPS